MKSNKLPLYDEKKCVFFALGRNAMYAACQALRLNRGDEVLTPAFDCDTALQPFRVLGLKLRFFKSNPNNFFADIEDIKQKITSDTKLIHVINHFGIPQPWDELLALRRDTGIPIMEDNAYSLFSAVGDRLLGTFGDVSIFSLRKSLPVVNGGFLCINTPEYSFELSRERRLILFSLVDVPRMLKITKDRLGMHRLSPGLRKGLQRMLPEVLPPPALCSDPEKGWPHWPWRDEIGKEFYCDFLRPISPLARWQLNRFTDQGCRDIIAKKRYYYLELAAKLVSLPAVKVLWPVIPEGVAPFCLSILISGGKRDSLLEKLRNKYQLMAWPILSGDVLEHLDDFPDVQILGRQLLQLNLPWDKVCLPRFRQYINGLAEEICRALV